LFTREALPILFGIAESGQFAAEIFAAFSRFFVAPVSRKREARIPRDVMGRMEAVYREIFRDIKLDEVVPEMVGDEHALRRIHEALRETEASVL